jgi:hypothetical protein
MRLRASASSEVFVNRSTCAARIGRSNSSRGRAKKIQFHSALLARAVSQKQRKNTDVLRTLRPSGFGLRTSRPPPTSHKITSSRLQGTPHWTSRSRAGMWRVEQNTLFEARGAGPGQKLYKLKTQRLQAPSWCIKVGPTLRV